MPCAILFGNEWKDTNKGGNWLPLFVWDTVTGNVVGPFSITKGT